jgi:IS5 family transposase
MTRLRIPSEVAPGETLQNWPETTILRFRHLLERHDLATDMLRVVNDILQAKGLLMRTGTAVDANAPSSTKNFGASATRK